MSVEGVSWGVSVGHGRVKLNQIFYKVLIRRMAEREGFEPSMSY